MKRRLRSVNPEGNQRRYDALCEGMACRPRPVRVERFTGPDYGWMWPFPRQVQGWIEEALPAIEAEIAAGSVVP